MNYDRLYLFALGVCVGLLFGCAPAPVLRVVDYCDLPHAECSPAAEQPPEIQAEFVEQAWCCTGSDPCVPVAEIIDCAITDLAIYCEYGRSVPATSPNGASGFECYG